MRLDKIHKYLDSFFFKAITIFFLDLLSEKSHLNYFNYKLILTITLYFKDDLMNYK